MRRRLTIGIAAALMPALAMVAASAQAQDVQAELKQRQLEHQRQRDLNTFLSINMQAIQNQLQVLNMLPQSLLAAASAQAQFLATQSQADQEKAQATAAAAQQTEQALQQGISQTISVANQLRATTASIAQDMSSIVSSTHVNSCPVFVGQSTLLTEDSCLWLKATGRKLDQSSVDAHTGSATFRVGGQKEIAEGWFLAGLAGFGQNWSQAGNGTIANGGTAEGAVALKRVIGPWFLSGALGFTSATLHMDRPDGVPGFNNRLQSDSSTFLGTGRVRAAYDFAFADWYVRPRFDFDLTYTSLPGYQESGASPLAMAVSGRDKLSAALTPTVEVGGRTNLSDTLILRPYLALGASFMPDNNWTMVASFQGPLSSLGSFQTTFYGPTVLANVEIGLQLYEVRGFEARVEYTLSAGDGFLSQGLSLRGARHF